MQPLFKVPQHNQSNSEPCQCAHNLTHVTDRCWRFPGVTVPNSKAEIRSGWKKTETYCNALLNVQLCCRVYFSIWQNNIDDNIIGTSSHSIYTLVETLTTDLQNVLYWCNSNNMSLNVSNPKLSHLDTNSRFLKIVIMIKVYVIVKYKLALLKNFLVSQEVILSAGMLILISLLKCKCNS